jgi:hypothetical protein
VEINQQMNHVVLDLIDSKEGIIKALVQSRMTKSLIGVRSKLLGPGTYFTAVKEFQMLEDDDITVKLEGYDMTGYVLDKSELKLQDIDYVIPLNALFENPFVRELKREINSSTSDNLKLIVNSK